MDFFFLAAHIGDGTFGGSSIFAGIAFTICIPDLITTRIGAGESLTDEVYVLMPLIIISRQLIAFRHRGHRL